MVSSTDHVVMVPFNARGHFTPLIVLVNRFLRRTTFNITITTTVRTLRRIQSAIVDSNNPRLHYVELPFRSTDHGLPPDVETTECLSLKDILTFCHASTTLQAPFEQLLKDMIATRPPVCVISDFINGWAVDVAKRVGVVGYCFNSCGAYGLAAYVSLWLNPPRLRTDPEAEQIEVPGFPHGFRLHRTQIPKYLLDADGNDTWSRFLQPQLALSLSSSGWLVNSVEEIEQFGLDVLRKYTKLPVWPIGPLVPSHMVEISSKDSSDRTQLEGLHSEISTRECIEWLDAHAPRSVLYVAFGSQNTISASQMMELALGLEDSNKPFIWVIRPPIGFDMKGEFKEEWLPPGFEHRVMRAQGRGLLVHGWAPQLVILKHPSIGAFMSHCGWNSVMEGLSQGVPIIGWPMAAEQMYNCKMLVEELHVCVELTRGVHGGLERKDVKDAINLIMENANGKQNEIDANAMEVGKKLRAALRDEEGAMGSSLLAMDDFALRMSSGSASVGSSISRGANVPCHCGAKSTIVSSWKPRSFGRRFRGCSKYWVGESCDYFEWVDPPTCEYGVEFGKKVMRRIEKLEQQLVAAEANHKESVNKLQLQLLQAKDREKEFQSVYQSMERREKKWRMMSYLCCVISVVMVLLYLHNLIWNMYRIGYPCLGKGYRQFV